MFGTSLNVYVDCDTYDTDEFYLGLAEQATRQTDVPFLDVSAAYNNGEIVIAVINRHKDNAIVTDLNSQEGLFDGDFEIYEVNGPDIKAENDFGKTNVKSEQKESVKLKKASTFTYKFPAHSLTMLKGKIVKQNL
jgi:alpha-N-arabinofuranosidase